MGILGLEKEFLPALVPFMSVLVVSLTISTSNGSDAITFVGIFWTLGISVLISHRLLKTIYNSWLGVLWGHNVNLRETGKWSAVTGGS